jgi:hypothetical protein
MSDPWELLRAASAHLTDDLCRDCTRESAKLRQRIDAALAEYDNPTWTPKSNNSNVIEAHTVEKFDRVLSVERMVMRDPADGIGYWARVGNSNINCYSYSSSNTIYR